MQSNIQVQRENAIKKSRGSRVTETQISAMIDFMESNRSLVTGKFLGAHGRDELKKQWSELANHLNGINGATKNSAQWQVTWRDLKSRTSIKVRNIRNSRAATGNKPIKEATLTPIVVRVVGLIGGSYIEGHNDCPDSTPEDQETIDRLVNGDDSGLMEPPETWTLFSANDEENDADATIVKEIPACPDVETDTVLSVPIESTSLITPPKIKKRVTGPLSTRVKRSCNRTRLSTQLHESKQEFAEISRTNANAMEVMANALKIQAEASLTAANAAQQQAEAAMLQATNDANRITVFKQLTDVLSQLLPQYAE